ncbi:MAG: MarR family winged helix-turn-helix transcriptional regulator [Actinomycetota bacterium]|nr:MarR family winged helix-turn-helix transcriptional regulator [Actinomycetota bacterium]
MYSSSGGGAEHVGQECLAAKVRRVHRVVVRIYDDALRSHGLTVAQLDLIATLLDHGGAARPSDLGRWLLMDRSTVTRNVERLRRLGLVECGPGANGREVEVRVTGEGRQLADRSLAAWEQAQGEVARLLGPDGVAALDLLTQRVST